MQAATYHEHNNEFLSMKFKTKYPRCSVMHSRYHPVIDEHFKLKGITKPQQAVYVAIRRISHAATGIYIWNTTLNTNNSSP